MDSRTANTNYKQDTCKSDKQYTYTYIYLLSLVERHNFVNLVLNASIQDTLA